MKRIVFLIIFPGLLILWSSIVNGQPSKAAFWDTQKKGTNYFNAQPTLQWFQSASEANIKFIRFSWEKWEGEQRDFLLGNADHYQGIVKSDFQKLMKYLNIADSLGMKVVITPISMPGARWSQNNNGVRDGRLWREQKFQEQAVQYWKELAERLKNHPAIVGYNIMNEPHPEYFFGKHSFWKRDLTDWYKTVKGTQADLNLFYQKIIDAIRKSDPVTPIVVESGFYATPWAFDYLEVMNDPNVIYSFHMYEPYHYTTFRINKNRFEYPGNIPVDEIDTVFFMNETFLKNFLEPVSEWTKKHNIPANRIWVGEFGCSRKVKGTEKYMEDLIRIFNENNWHWSFYSYKEDVWDDMDYELGTGKVFHKYWEYSENKELHLHYNEIYGFVKNNPIWLVLKKEFD